MKKILILGLLLVGTILTGCNKMLNLKGVNSKNYTIISEKAVPDLNFNIVELSHNKTKAKILLFICDDENRVFNIAFRTPVDNSKGMPHILEHSILCGSEKYSIKDPYTELAKGSLNTFLNAFTYPDKTCYPVASANLKDFHNLVDVYLDAVFYPNAIKDEKIFMQEGWHYEIEGSNDDLKVNGVVYNEMKGAFSDPSTLLDYNIIKGLYKGTGYQYESGGDPEEIINLTYDEFVDFHHKYYSASNATIFYYGKLDFNEELEYLDREYLSKQEYVKCNSEIKDSTEWIPNDEIVSEYNLDSDDTKNKSYIAYSFAFDEKKDNIKQKAMGVLNYILFGADNAIIKNKCLAAGLGESVSSSYDLDFKSGMFNIVARNIDESKKDEFVKLIDDSIKEIIENGLDKEKVKSALNVLYFNNAEEEYGSYPKGLYMTLTALQTYLYGEDYSVLLGYKDAFKFLDSVDLDDKNNYFIKLLKEAFVDNEHRCVNILKPKKGYLLEKEKKLNEILSNRKADMSEDGMHKIVEKCIKLKEFQKEEDRPEDLAKMPMLKISDIDRDRDVFSYKNKDMGNSHTVFTYDNDKDIVYFNMSFDISDFTPEEIYLTSAMSYLITKIDLGDMTIDDFQNYVDLNTGGVAAGISVFPQKTFFTYKIKVSKDKMDYIFDIFEKLISNVVFNDKEKIEVLINENKTNAYLNMLSDGHAAAMNRALSTVVPYAKVIDSISTTGVGFNLFINEFSKVYTENPEFVKSIFTNLYEKIMAQEVTYQYSINEKYASELETKLKSFIDKQNQKVKPLDFSELDSGIDKLDDIVHFDNFAKTVKKEAIVTPNDINFCAAANVFDANEYSGRLKLLRTIFNYEYLWTNLRVLGGAYGCMFSCNRTGNYGFASYRDPNLSKTNEVYKNVADFLSTFSKDEDDFTKYIIGTMGTFDNPLTTYEKFNENITAFYYNVDNDLFNKERHDVLDTKVSDIKDLAPIFEGVEDGSFCALISEKSENEAKDEYDKIWKISQ